MNYELNVIAGLTRNPLTVFCIFFALFLFSCEDKVIDYGLDKYYVEIVTVQSENVFLSDNGKMIVAEPNENKKKYASDDRVLINYTLLETNVSGDYRVRINGLVKVPQGKLTLTNGTNINSSANDPILLESVWLGSHYLNMQFYINYKSVAHKIALIADSTRLGNDTIRMYFVHDINNDPPGYPSHSYLSFDLKEVLGETGKSRPVTVQINSSNYGDKSYAFEY